MTKEVELIEAMDKLRKQYATTNDQVIQSRISIELEDLRIQYDLLINQEDQPEVGYSTNGRNGYL